MSAAAALLPVVVFLAALYLMDSFKLVPMRHVVLTLAAGAISALFVLWFHRLLPLDGWPPEVVSRYIAPLTEEAAKALIVLLLIARGRVGFLVDAAVMGFAIGAGFSLVENVLYLKALPHATVWLFLVRGLGTAMLHGATTAIVAMVARARIDRRGRGLVVALLPGYALAVVIHSASNHLLLQPVAQTLIVLMILPAIVIWVFDRSERATREWVSAGLDLDLEVLQLIVSEHFNVTRFGRYLEELRARFPGPVVADMYCLLRLELELSVQAKALVMARGAGLELPADADLDAALAERSYLHRSIGATGLLALKPLQVTTHRDQWHRHLLHRSR
jgi:RsiW-degrading membrane proteinase PrsW (M82 family)